MDINISHGLLLEDFNSRLNRFILEHNLDIQTKTMAVEMILLRLKELSNQQTEKEFEEYQNELNTKNIEEEN